jgi:hypothetical protein
VGKNTCFLVVSKIKSDVACIAECSGYPLTSEIGKNMHHAKELVLKDRRMIIFETANNGKHIWVSLEHFQRQSEYVQIAIPAEHGTEGESC